MPDLAEHHRASLRAYVAKLFPQYPQAKIWNPGVDDARYAVMSQVEPCELCAVSVVVLHREDRERPAWYQVGGMVTSGHRRGVRFKSHTQSRCRAARPPKSGASDV